MANACIPLYQKHLFTLQLEYDAKNCRGARSEARAITIIMIVRSSYYDSLQYIAYPN